MSYSRLGIAILATALLSPAAECASRIKELTSL